MRYSIQTTRHMLFALLPYVCVYFVVVILISESELLCNWQPVNHFVLALSPSGDYDQILAVDRQLQDDVMRRLPW